MTHAIIGFGAVGQALARAFARKEIEVIVAARRPAEALLAQAQAIGPAVRPEPLAEAVKADTVILAYPFPQHGEVARVAPSWKGKLVVDATNAYGTPLAEFGGLTASAFAARQFSGARFVKGFNHLPAAKLSDDPDVNGGRRVIFIAGDDGDALNDGAALMERLGYAPVSLGSLAEGSPLTSARGNAWSPLNFQDFVKFDG